MMVWRKTFKNDKMTTMQLFTAISMTGSVLFLIVSIVLGNVSFRWLMLENDTSHMAIDYYNHVLFASDPANLYVNVRNTWGAEWACFPPLIYMLYFVLYRMTSLVEFTPKDWVAMKQLDEASTVFLYYSIFVAVGILFAILLWNRQGKKNDSLKLFICLMLSVPFFTGFERGNSCMLVFVLLLLVLKWKDSESTIKREAALMMIAVCAGIKIYPAVFGVLYIREKRFRECLRLIVYGVVLFFVPFLFFGGMRGFLQWLSNIQDTMVVDSLGRIEYIRGLVNTVSFLVFGTTADYVSLVLSNFFLIVMLALAIISTDKYRITFYLCSIMAFYPSNAFRYTLCFLSIPLVMYLMEHGSEKPQNRFLTTEIIAFGLLFSVPSLWGLVTGFNYCFRLSRHLTYVELWLYTVAYVVTGMIVAHEIYDVIHFKRVNPILQSKIVE